MSLIICVTLPKATLFLKVLSACGSPHFQPPSCSLNLSVSLERILIYAVAIRVLLYLIAPTRL